MWCAAIFNALFGKYIFCFNICKIQAILLPVLFFAGQVKLKLKAKAALLHFEATQLCFFEQCCILGSLPNPLYYLKQGVFLSISQIFPACLLSQHVFSGSENYYDTLFDISSEKKNKTYQP